MDRKHLEKWVKDAYAMEQSAIKILEKQESRMDEYPELQGRIREHLAETKWQADQLKRCMDQLDIDQSTFKDMTAKVMGNVSAMTNASAEDEVVKNMISNASFEHMEIASYRSLQAAAQEYGELDLASVCEQILRQEESMGRWCDENIGNVTRQFLSYAEVQASR